MYRIDEKGNKVENDLRVNRGSGRILTGLIFIVIGALFLARKMGASIPHWIFSWELMLIAIGILVGAKHRFRGFGWTIPVLIGVVFLLDDLLGGIRLHTYFWPVFIMGVGLYIIFKPKATCRRGNEMEDVTEDMIDATAVFGGVKKMVTSRNFKGGEVTTVFGGAEIDLSQADITEKAVLEVNQVFGGTKLIVPPHWKVVSEVTVVMGGIEDKRPYPKDGPDPGKVLVLKGSCIMGGLDIKSY